MKQKPASPSAFVQAVLDIEGLTLQEQYDVLQLATAAVNRKRQEESHNRKV